jgi:hypothetical protein
LLLVSKKIKEDVSKINILGSRKLYLILIDDKDYSMNEVYDYFEIKNNRIGRKLDRNWTAFFSE